MKIIKTILVALSGLLIVYAGLITLENRTQDSVLEVISSAQPGAMIKNVIGPHGDPDFETKDVKRMSSSPEPPVSVRWFDMSAEKKNLDGYAASHRNKKCGRSRLRPGNARGIKFICSLKATATLLQRPTSTKAVILDRGWW